jgi:acyl-coenzyme A thioesterase PaaI-like protein
MPAFEPRDPDFERKVRASFARQQVMRLFGAALARIEPGLVEIELPYRADLTQQHGYLSEGERFLARGQVVRAGRTLTVCELKVEAVKGGERTACAYGTQTLICLPASPAGPPPG